MNEKYRGHLTKKYLIPRTKETCPWMAGEAVSPPWRNSGSSSARAGELPSPRAMAKLREVRPQREYLVAFVRPGETIFFRSEFGCVGG